MSFEPKTTQYDTFLSFAGPDREIGRKLRGELIDAGLSVFFDEAEISEFTSISGSIITALRQSKTFLAYYSAHYTDRWCPQAELVAAYLGAQKQNESDRILVINPEPATSHIYPKTLVTNAMQFGTATDLPKIANKVKERINGLNGVLEPQLEYGANLKDSCFRFEVLSGRHAETWNLHTALTTQKEGSDFAGPALSVIGLKGIGKSALTTLYGRRFEAAFPGGVYKMRPNEHTGQLIERLCTPKEPHLVIVDNTQPDFDAALLGDSLGVDSHSLLISREIIPNTNLPVFKVGPLALGEARRLLEQYRPAEDDRDWAVINQLIAHVNGNAGEIVRAGKALRDMQGLVSYEDYFNTLIRNCG